MGLRDLPLAPGERHVKAFERAGWRQTRKTRGSHAILEKEGVDATLSIPCHKGKDVKRALLSKQIKLAGMTGSEYLKHFK